MKNKKLAVLKSVISLLLCVSMLAGTTFAWFTDGVRSGRNTIVAGNLDVELEYMTANGEWLPVTADTNVFEENTLWEPGHTEVVYLRVSNAGTLALKYQLGVNIAAESGSVNVAGEEFVLSDYIEFAAIEDVQTAFASRDAARAAVQSAQILSTGYTKDGQLLPGDPAKYVAFVVYMPETVTNEANYRTGELPPRIELGISLFATQFTHEADSFGDNYDYAAGFPDGDISLSGKTDITTENGMTSAAATITAGAATADVPAGVQVNDGATALELSVNKLPTTGSNITAATNEDLLPVDVHVEGVSASNTTPVKVRLAGLAPIGLNMGNLKLYHVENGETNPMTRVATEAELTAHNQFFYDPATGDVVLSMATFSEVALVADTKNAWEGEFDYTWYDASKTEFTIANADQLAAFGAIVGGMANVKYPDGQERDSFKDKTVKLCSYINLGDKNDASTNLFYPIGYYNDAKSYTKPTDGTAIAANVTSFQGTFDGNGHTIANFYQNTWQMWGNYDGNNYKAAMGLFGYVVNGTVKNLTVDHFSSDGEFTPTGVIAAYAVNSTFENIATTNCNPRVYNTGNGGIIGIAGNSNDQDKLITLKNITVDNSNKITALWGSWDVACGGLVGMFRGNADGGTGKIHFENCHVSAQIDVYNDVCANYQYYAYRYAGMIIGSVRHNTTNSDGKTVPAMAGISANGCTVNYGDWNNYYYCELVANTLASYTHDHQFSRLTEVSTLPESAEGTAHYYVKNEDGTITCRHFINGKLHEHEDSGEETVDGKTVLKEDKTCVYLPFKDQLFTGYSWGVSSIGIKEFEGFLKESGNDDGDGGFSEGDQQESVEKFEPAQNVPTTLTTGKQVKIKELFAAKGIARSVANINGAAVQVAVYPDPADPSSTAGGIYEANEQDWTEGTVTFTGVGKAIVSITDYQFCKLTTIGIAIEAAEKFETKFTNKNFIYRVGNENKIDLGTIFKLKEGASVGSASVKLEVERITGDAGCKLEVNDSDWTLGKVEFSGTGIVNVRIIGDGAVPVELKLEVVDATNLTSATGTTTGGNFVLICDVNTSTYVNYWNCTVYGNGFTYSLKGAPTAYNSKQGKGVIITKNSTLDNVVIVGDIYTGYGAFTENDYYNTVIDVTGDTTIQNCYIANCAAPVRARNNVTIINSTLYGGAVGNLIIESGTVTLKDVTTANYDDGRDLVGMGIVVHSDATEAAKLVLKGKFTQHNFISESKVPTDTYAKNLHNAMFKSDCSKYQFGTSPNRYVNTGIISLTSTFNGEDITDNANTGYVGQSVTVSGSNGYVYTQPNTSESVNNNYNKDTDTHMATTQGAVPPNYSFDYTNKNYIAKTDGSNDYCYEENGKVNISMDEGDTFNWDTSILTIGKGITNYTVSMNGTDYTGKSIAFNTAGDYTVTYTYTDGNNYKLDANGNITTYSVTYTKTVEITVAVVKATTKHAEFTFGSSNTASTTVTIGNNTYVMPNVSGTSSTVGSTTVNGQTIYYPIVEIIMSDGKTTHSSGWYAYFPVFSGAVTITDYADKGTGDKMTPYNGSTTTMPSGLSVVGDAKTLFKYQSGSNAGETPVVKNNILVYSSAKIEANRNEYNTVVQYSYTDNAGATYYYYIGYHAVAQKYSPSCVTGDTLVTLADGSQVRVDALTGSEQLLVWNHTTGKLESAPVAYIVDHEKVVQRNKVAQLFFADGTDIKIIGEHVFFDASLNKYVTITTENAREFVGHRFVSLNAQGNALQQVRLSGVKVYYEETATYEVVSYEHLTCFTNGVLSASAYMDKLLNIFEITEETMAYDAESVRKDIEKYGLYTYADFEGLISEEAFELYNAKCLKIAVGKGYIDWDDILDLIDIFFNVNVQPLQ